MAFFALMFVCFIVLVVGIIRVVDLAYKKGFNDGLKENNK